MARDGARTLQFMVTPSFVGASGDDDGGPYRRRSARSRSLCFGVSVAVDEDTIVVGA